MALVIASVVSAVAAVGSAVAGQVGAAQAAGKQKKYNAAIERAQAEYRREQLAYQNRTWEQDLAYAHEVLSYSRSEFTRQTEWADKAVAAATRNRDADAFTVALRGIEETIASTFQGTSMARQGRAARASYSARDRNVEGASVEAVIADVMRQEGDAANMIDMNRSATMRQLSREAVALDANADAQISQIAAGIKTFSPQAPVRAPGPVPAVNPTAPVNEPSPWAMAGAVIGGVAQGWNSYNAITGQNGQQTMNQLTGWVSRQFQFSTPSTPSVSTTGSGGAP